MFITKNNYAAIIKSGLQARNYGECISRVDLLLTDGNTNNAFNIDSTTGVISTAKALDYETTTSYALVIKATDNGTPINTSSMTLTITITNVNDNAPKCPSSFLYATVPENAVNQQVANLFCFYFSTKFSRRYFFFKSDS